MINRIMTFATLLIAIAAGSKAQPTRSDARLIGPCEGCEAIFEYGDRNLTNTDTLHGFTDAETPIKVHGTIYLPDGKTPAGGVILYVYHADKNGIYSPGSGASGWERRHGDDRGWMKTGADGKYTFYTSRPGTYPSRAEAAHIHPIILEPDGKYYWLGSYYFSDDPLLNDAERNPGNPRGGTAGVMQLAQQGDLWAGTRDFVLGMNIPGYEQ